jgi:hypothetical protein
MQTLVFKSAGLTFIAAFAIAALVLASQPQYRGIRAGRADENYLDSRKCIACHPDHYVSWARTYHSRMTQEAWPTTVQGDFERDNRLEYLGVKALMERRGRAFTMTLEFGDSSRRVFTVDRTIGSRRVEQYLSKQEGQYLRLPLAYDLINRRWISLNGSFFYPDGRNYFQHQTQWDSNCVFCHNVKAQPHLNPKNRAFDTQVTELGIACGACHGPAAAHAQQGTSPFVRAWWRLGAGGNKQIVNPKKLTPERALMVCGHCHGQRVPEPLDRIQELMTRGDPYNAGDDLASFYRPVWRETKVGEYSFANRFWNNGAPRLTAYEYQGLLRSRCFLDGDRRERINCLTCHSMHEGDPKGQIKPENRTDTPCLACHQQFAQAAALTQHTKHKSDSIGRRCYNCHMPRVVYGIMSFHPTHEITVPDPHLTATQAVPNACNQCHLDKSVNWAISASKQWWPGRFSNAKLGVDNQFNFPEGPRALFAGDALTRALAAEAMGGGGPMKLDANWANPFLIEAFADNYPIVRFFAAHGLNHRQLAKPDYLGAPAARQSEFDLWWALYPADRQQVTSLAHLLRALRVNVDIEVGE